MNSIQPALLEHILERISVGVVILDCVSLRILYVNTYLQTLLPSSWQAQSLIGYSLKDILPDEEFKIVEPILHEVCSTDRETTFSDVPYEGFLEARGRTYWHISIEHPQSTLSNKASVEEDASELQDTTHKLFITIKDVTNQVRASLHLNAIHQISSAILERFSLPQVLDSILQAVQDLVGSTRCAIVLLEHTLAISNQERDDLLEKRTQTAVVTAQKGLHLRSQDWHQLVNEQLLLSQVLDGQESLVIPDTDAWPSIKFPLLDDNGIPRRPGSVLCVPIFEPDSNTRSENNPAPLKKYSSDSIVAEKKILGTIEVYHRRARGLPIEEVELLEQFAQQAGLAIQSARLFLNVDHLAQVAREQAHQRENVMQAIPDGVIIYDSRWHIVETNNAIRNLLGWSEDVKGLHITEALHRSTAVFPSNSPSISDLVEELERFPHEKRVDEFKMIGADRKQYSIRRSKAPIQDDSSNIFAYAIVYHDVTEQATAREQIEAQVIARTSELAQQNQALQAAQAAQELESARLRLLMKRLPSGVLLVSAADKGISVINHQAIELLQRIGVPLSTSDDADQLAEVHIGLNIEEAFRALTLYDASGSIIPYENQPLSSALQNGEVSEVELRITETDGQILFLLISAAPLHNQDGRITDAVLVLQDFTKLKILERAREDFFTTMAHELKTPLANIRAHLSALQADDFKWSPEAQHDFLETADEQVERLVGMINHFLDASRVEAGALRLEIEPILLAEMFEDLQERLEALISSSQRRFELHIQSDLPAVQADYELIMSVLTNLLSNAFRYAPEGDTVRLEAESISSSSTDHPVEVEIRVVDRGPGITDERQAELFTRFSTFAALRRPTAERPGQPISRASRGNFRWSPATGLGLYISRGIIEAHGSELRLKSSLGEGATFAFTLPVATSTNSEV
jgi:PAS domain S-box-containing protein